MLPCALLSNLPHTHKWVYIVGVRPWNVRTRKMRMWLNAHLVWKSHLWQNSLPPASQHPQLRQKEGRSHCWLPSETNRGPSMPTRSNPWWRVLSSWCLSKGHHQEISQPFMAHWLLPTTGFPGKQHQEGFGQPRGTSGPWDYWLRDLELVVFSSELPMDILCFGTSSSV